MSQFVDRMGLQDLFYDGEHGFTNTQPFWDINEYLEPALFFGHSNGTLYGEPSNNGLDGAVIEKSAVDPTQNSFAPLFSNANMDYTTATHPGSFRDMPELGITPSNKYAIIDITDTSQTSPDVPGLVYNDYSCSHEDSVTPHMFTNDPAQLDVSEPNLAEKRKSSSITVDTPAINKMGRRSKMRSMDGQIQMRFFTGKPAELVENESESTTSSSPTKPKRGRKRVFRTPSQQGEHDNQYPSIKTSVAPLSFIHQETCYEIMEHDRSPMTDSDQMDCMDANIHSSVISCLPNQTDMAVNAPTPALVEKFRFHVTLNAPTAMIKHADEMAITYLNKGQAYSISIIDTAPMTRLPPGARYRTVIRISFEEEQQRRSPALCWQLWKEGRGTNEAHQRGGKLQAVEYVKATPAESDNEPAQVDLVTASLDGFSVIWATGSDGSKACNIAVRFNFLSTDFSHSKGVKGIPIRLCAKTETIPTGSPHAAVAFSEVAFCKVKLFRENGSERKLSNDVAQVKKTIDKLKQQISQAESGIKYLGKRKKSGSITSKAQPSQRPGKVINHKRAWSMSLASSAGSRISSEKDLHYKLQSMQDMLISTRLVSVLYLPGSEQNDRDLHVVALTEEPSTVTKVDPKGTTTSWQQKSSDHSSKTRTCSLISPSPSSILLQSRSAPAAPSVAGQRPSQSLAPFDLASANLQKLASPPDQLSKVSQNDETGSLSKWIEALKVDSAHHLPWDDRSVKPVACFYILNRDPGHPVETSHYQAIYLPCRNLRSFRDAIAVKWNLESTKIFRILHVLDRGLEVEVDDDVIRELAEGQDLIMEIVPVKIQSPDTKEWEMTVDIILDGDNVTGSPAVQSEGYELRLMF